MAEIIACQENQCYKCSLRFATQRCSCEQILCSFCARNHWKTIKALNLEDHKFDSQDLPIPDPYLSEIMHMVVGVFDKARDEVSKFMVEIDDQIADCYKRTGSKQTSYKAHLTQKITELKDWKDKTQEICEISIETQKCSKSLYENLKEMQTIYSLINEIYCYMHSPIDESQAIKHWKNYIGPLTMQLIPFLFCLEIIQIFLRLVIGLKY